MIRRFIRHLLDTTRQERALVRLYRQNRALRALCSELEDRPTPTPDERITLTDAGARALDTDLLEKRYAEALNELGRARGTIERLETSLAGEQRRRREAEARIAPLSTSLSTREVKETLHRRWEAQALHGGLPIDARPGGGE